MASPLSQSALMRPGPEVGALRTVFGDLLATPGGTEHIAHLLAGTTEGFAPDLVIHTDAGTRRLADVTTTGRPLLLDLSGDFAEAAQPWHDQVDVIRSLWFQPWPGRYDESLLSCIAQPRQQRSTALRHSARLHGRKYLGSYRRVTVPVTMR
ncbi:hypothetical protein AB0D58_32325 [Streptomyces sp. NPDC048210]|uniref:aromatic-ring hydroxylase C-terminal domain-containing protein n=1 Tax=Streptomyces sp. NPDC048210 TaxID=3156657 RepID=UPI0034147111